MTIVTILGTHPEIVRMSRLIPLLDEMAEHVLDVAPNIYPGADQSLVIAEPNRAEDCRSS